VPQGRALHSAAPLRVQQRPTEPGSIPAEPAASPVPGAPLRLAVRGLAKTYGGTAAVRGIDFAVRAGEVLGLVGPNGAGKTTTLRTVAGVLPIQTGQVTVAGFDLQRQEREAKRRLAWVPDDPQPFDALTVEEHLEFVAALYGVRDFRPRAAELVERFELTEKRRALGGELSRGMRQKLAFCCAWLPRPELVLLDEPLSGLDPRGIRSAKAAIRDLAAEGSAVVLSSHLLDLVEELSTRLLVLDRGTVAFAGTLAEARALPSGARGGRLEEIFFGEEGRGPAAPAPGDVAP
jgi:ABC-2 type transport system ATP-binding protein